MIISNFKKYFLIASCIIVGYVISSLVVDFIHKKNEKFFYHSTIAISNPLNVNEDLALKIINSNNVFFENLNFPAILSTVDGPNNVIRKYVSGLTGLEANTRSDFFYFTDSFVMDSKIKFNDDRVCKGENKFLSLQILENEFIYKIKIKLHILDEYLNQNCMKFIESNLQDRSAKYRNSLVKNISKEIIKIKKIIEEIKTKKNMYIIQKNIKDYNFQNFHKNFVIKYYNQNLNILYFLLNEYSKTAEVNFKIIKIEKEKIDPKLRYSAINYMGIYFGFLIGLIIVFYKKVLKYLEIVWKK